MRESGILVCSLFEYNHQAYIRFAKVKSIKDYKQALTFWYPDMEWKLQDHKAWYNLPANLENTFSKIDKYINDIYGNIKSIQSSHGFYYCVGIKHIVKESFFEEIHKIILTEIENDDNDDEDLSKELEKHNYDNRSIIYGIASVMMKNEKPIDTTTYKYEPLNVKETFYLNIGCKEYTVDPWNEEYPIVWSSNALKDFIFEVKKHSIVIYSWEISKHMSKNISNFWMIDDTLNVRSKSINGCITNCDIFYLFTQIGNIGRWFDSLYIAPFDVCNATEMLNEYYELLNTNKTCSVPEPICESLPHGRLFGHYELLNTNKMSDGPQLMSASLPHGKLFGHYEVVNDKNIPIQSEEKPDEHIVLLVNRITKAIECILQSSTTVLLPEIENLHTITQIDKKYGELLITEFNKYKDVQPSLQHDLAILLDKKIKYCNEYIIVSETKQTDKESSVKNIYTTRYVIEYLLQTCKLIPTDKWVPASMVLEIFMNYIQSLQKRKKEFAALQCQRNQLSIILADIVPKKRFVSGQMFQIQLPTPLVIEKTISELIQKVESN